MASVIGLVVLASGCSSRAVEEGGTDGNAENDPTEPGGDEVAHAIQLTVNRDVDVLFVIDNSGSMGEAQARLSRNFAALTDVLEDVEANYRIGVTTTDNGNPLCPSTSPEGGRLQLSSCLGRTAEFVSGVPPADATTACTDLCVHDTISTVPTTTELDPDAKPRPWLERLEGASNLVAVDGVVPTIVEAFQCVGPQGIAGCGFESHLESMYKALLRTQKQGEEQHSFLRSNAVLSIVIVTDELDCSYENEFASIFSTEAEGGDPSVFWSDPEASAPSSAVCFNAGVVCSGGPGVYDECHAANKDVGGAVDVADGDAVLHPVHRYVDFVQGLEDEKQQITPDQEVLVALIAGVPVGYDEGLAEITYADASGQEEIDFGIGAGCVDDGSDPPASARPPVREREFAEAFAVGADGRNSYSVCADDFSPALNAIANAIADQLQPACVPGCVADTDLASVGVQPSCVLVQETPDPGGGGVDELFVEACDGMELPEGAEVCYLALVDPDGSSTPSGIDRMSELCADAGWNLEFALVRAPGAPTPGGTSVSVDCEWSRSKKVDCPGLP